MGHGEVTIPSQKFECRRDATTVGIEVRGRRLRVRPHFALMRGRVAYFRGCFGLYWIVSQWHGRDPYQGAYPAASFESQNLFIKAHGRGAFSATVLAIYNLFQKKIVLCDRMLLRKIRAQHFHTTVSHLILFNTGRGRMFARFTPNGRDVSQIVSHYAGPRAIDWSSR